MVEANAYRAGVLSVLTRRRSAPRHSRITAAVATFALIGALGAGCTRDTATGPAPGPDITACAAEPDRPLVYLDTGGDPTGFSFVLLSDIVERRRGALRLDRVSASRVVARLLDGSCDTIVSTVTDDPTQLETVDLSTPFTDDDLAFAVRALDAPTLPSAASLAGRPIGTVEGSAADTWLSTNAPPGSTVSRFPGDGDVFAALRKGRVDAVVTRRIAIAHRTTQDDAISLGEVIPTGRSIGFAVRPGDTATLEFLNSGLAELDEDGSLAELRQRWFGDQSDG